MEKFDCNEPAGGLDSAAELDRELGLEVIPLPSQGSQSFDGVQCKKNGRGPNLVLVEGLVRDGNRRFLYYGVADNNVGLASAAGR